MLGRHLYDRIIKSKFEFRCQLRSQSFTNMYYFSYPSAQQYVIILVYAYVAELNTPQICISDICMILLQTHSVIKNYPEDLEKNDDFLFI